MAKQSVVKTIGNCKFEFLPIPPSPAIKLVTRILKIVGEPVGLVLDGAVASGEGNIVQKLLEGKIAKGVLAEAVRSLINRLDENEVEQTIFMLMEYVHGQLPGDKGVHKLNIDIDFQGEIGLLFEVFVAAVEVNFGTFLRGRLAGATSSLSQ